MVQNLKHTPVAVHADNRMRQRKRVGAYLLLNTVFDWPYTVVLPIVFCAKSIVIFVRSIVLLANPEARSMRYNTTQENRFRLC